MPPNHLILCHPLFLPPSIFPSIRVFSNESVLHIRWPKYCSISPSNEYSGLVSFRIECVDLLAAQGTLKSLLQHHRSKASALQCSAFFVVQLSHPYRTIGKAIALTRQNFVCKIISLLFNMLSESEREVAQSCLTLCDPTAAGQASLSITNSWSLLKLMSVESVMPSNHFLLSYPLLQRSSMKTLLLISELHRTSASDS